MPNTTAPPQPHAPRPAWLWLPPALALLITTWPLLIGRYFIWGLASLQFVPWYELSRRAWQAGQVPLWNPLMGAGEPLLANYQSGVFYLFNLAYSLVGHVGVLGWVTVLHLVVAFFGLWLWAGTLPDTTPLSRTVAALAYTFSGPIIDRIDIVVMLGVAAWLPWLLWAVSGLLASPHPRRAAPVAAFTALILLSGHAQWGFYALLLAGTLALAQVIIQRRSPVVLLWALAAVLLGGLLAGIQLVPTLEAVQQSARATGLSYADITNFSWHPISAFLLLSPVFFGHPGWGTFIPNGFRYEINAYIGVLPLFVLLWLPVHAWQQRRAGLLGEPRWRWLLVFALVALAGLVFAAGQFSPLFPLLYRYVPTFDAFRGPNRWLIVVVISMAGALAVGLPHWRPHLTRIRLLLAGLAATALIAAVALAITRGDMRTIAIGLFSFSALGAASLAVALRRPPASAPATEHWRWGLAVVVLVSLDMSWAALHVRPSGDADFYAPRLASTARSYWPDDMLQTVQMDEFITGSDYRLDAAQQEALRTSGLPNLGALDASPSINSLNPLRPAITARFAELLDEHNNPALFTAAAIGDTPPAAPTPTVPAGVARLGRAWVVPDVQWVTDQAAAETAMLDPNWDPAQTVILIGEDDGQRFDQALVASVAFVQETPSQVALQVQSDTPGWLVLADTFYPGWQVTINNRLAPIYQANLAFRAVPIASGDQFVVFSYVPRSWLYGLAFSGAGLVLLVLFALWPLPRRLNANAPHEAGHQSGGDGGSRTRVRND